MKSVNPRLLAIASHDFHRKDSYYDVGIEMDVPELSREAILHQLRQGSYTMKSRFFCADPCGRINWVNAASVQMLSPALKVLRNARALLSRWSS